MIELDGYSDEEAAEIVACLYGGGPRCRWCRDAGRAQHAAEPAGPAAEDEGGQRCP